jgi:hypothetical protein
VNSGAAALPTPGRKSRKTVTKKHADAAFAAPAHNGASNKTKTPCLARSTPSSFAIDNGHPDRLLFSGARNGWPSSFKQLSYHNDKRLLYCLFPCAPGTRL